MTDEGTPDRPADRSDVDERRPAGLDVASVTRLYAILDAAVDDAAGLDDSGIDQLLSLLETVLVAPPGPGPAEIDRLFTVLETAIVDPTGPDATADVLPVLTAATAIDPDSGDREDTASRSGRKRTVGPPRPDTLARGLRSVAEGVADTVLSPGARTGNGERPGFDPRDDPADWADDLADRDGNDAFRIARIVAATMRRTGGYTVESGVRTGTELVRVAMQAESLAEVLEETRAIAFEEFERLGLIDGTDGDRTPRRTAGTRSGWGDPEEYLRERGHRLLERAADVDTEPSPHPAYANVLDALAADEARILRYLATDGPQPSVDVRDVGYLPITSELVAAGLSMVGTESGCLHEDRLPAYLNNLKRLGLVWFSDEPVDNVTRYQVLKAQPDVSAALEECRRPKLIRRSIHLTPFGVDFCRVCLPVEVEADDAAGVYEPPKTGRT